MAKEKIKVRITRDGKTEITVEDVKGKSCVDATKNLEIHLGNVSSKEFTSDYYKSKDPGKKNWIKE